MPFPSRPIPSTILYMKRDGSTAFTGNVSLGGYTITNSGIPVNPTDLATKDYVDNSAGGGGDLKADGTVPLTADWDIDGFVIKGAGTPVDPNDVATKAYVDSNTPTGVLLADGSVQLTDNWDVGGVRLLNLQNPSSPQDAATKTYIDTALTAYVKANGTVAFTAAQSMGGFKLTNLGTPTLTTDAATKAYADGVVTGYLKADGSVPLTANWNLGNYQINGLAGPSLSTDAATKGYVDSNAVPSSRTLTGTAPIAIDGVNSAVTLSANRTISIVNATGSLAGAVSTSSQTFGGAKTFQDGLVIPTTKTISGSAELNYNVATANDHNFQVNNSTVMRLKSDGSLQLATNITSALSGVLVIANNKPITALLNGGSQTQLLKIGTNDQITIGDTSTSKAIQHATGSRMPWRGVADTNTSVTELDHIVAYTSLTATRTVTLPSASTVGAGFYVIIKDESNSASNSIKISVAPPSGTIEGASTIDISVAYGWAVFYSNGTNWFQL